VRLALKAVAELGLAHSQTMLLRSLLVHDDCCGFDSLQNFCFIYNKQTLILHQINKNSQTKCHSSQIIVRLLIRKKLEDQKSTPN
jgi:hypothetical protein